MNISSPPSRSRHLRWAVPLLVAIAAACGGDEPVEDDCDFCDRVQREYGGDLSIETGIAGYSIYQSDSWFACGAPCEFATAELQVASVDTAMDEAGLWTLLADTAVQWTTHTAGGSYELALTGSVAVCWQYGYDTPWPNTEDPSFCASFTIQSGQVWTVHPFGFFGPGELIVFDPSGDPWPSVTLTPSFDE